MTSGVTRVVVPCYNEADRLPLKGFKAFLERTSEVEFVFVDDGSTDGTGELLRRFAAEYPARIHTVRLQTNLGKAEAVRHGINTALESSPRYVGYWDADLATPLDAILPFRAILNREPRIEWVIGSRVKLLGRDISRNAYRHYLGRIFATVASQFLGIPVYDTQCGAKLFRVSHDLADLFERPFAAGWIFDVELLARFLQAHGPERVGDLVYEFPLTSWRDVEGSKLRALDFARAAREMILLWRNYSPRELKASAPAALQDSS